MPKNLTMYVCSFCGKNGEQVHRLIAGPDGVYICDECVRLCSGIIEEESAAAQQAQEEFSAPPSHEVVSTPLDEDAPPALPDIVSRAQALWNSKAAYWDERFGEGNQFHRELIEPPVLYLLDPRPDEIILDVACGNGAFSRKLASLGTRVVAFDFSEVFIERAQARSQDYRDRIDYHLLDATDASHLAALGEGKFDAAVANMALMDIPDIEPLVFGLSRLLTPAGRFVFTVQHPCFNSNAVSIIARIGQDDGTMTRAMEIRGYLDVPAGEGGGMPGEPNPHLYFHRPLNELFRVFFRHGFMLDGFEEPTLAPSEEVIGWSAVGGQIPPILAVRMRLRSVPAQ